MIWLLASIIAVAVGYPLFSAWRNPRRDSAFDQTSAAPRSGESAEGFAYGQSARKAQFARQLDARLGVPKIPPSLDPALLRAYEETPVLRRLIREEFRRTISLCVHTHWLAGVACQAATFTEIALKPECFALRQRVIETGEAAVERLYDYPLLPDNSDLLRNLIVIRDIILPCCRDCPFLPYPVLGSVPYCPSAKFALIPPDEIMKTKIIGGSNEQQ